MFDLKIDSWQCTFELPNNLVIRTVGCYDIADRIVYLGNWNDGCPTLRPEDDSVRESNPEQAVLAVLDHEIVHDVLKIVDVNVNFDRVFLELREDKEAGHVTEDEFGMPDWKPCFYCGSKMESPLDSAVCRRCHEEEIGLE
jgi:hypothetical protein